MLATICNLLSGYLGNYNFTGSLILMLAVSLLLFIYNVFLSPGAEHILVKPMAQLINFHDFELYNKELASFLINKSNRY